LIFNALNARAFFMRQYRSIVIGRLSMRNGSR
jgi:hypothetical protein